MDQRQLAIYIYISQRPQKRQQLHSHKVCRGVEEVSVIEAGSSEGGRGGRGRGSEGQPHMVDSERALY